MLNDREIRAVMRAVDALPDWDADKDVLRGLLHSQALSMVAQDAAPQPAEPVGVPSDAVQRDASSEYWMGMRVVAYQWEIDNDFGKMTRHAMHWSTGPKDAERLFRESDIRDLLARYNGAP